jgi:tetratricopeptide (TPR) repeat protein
VFLGEQNRRVLPRWRDFETTLRLGELRNLKPREAVSREDSEIVARRFFEWQHNPTIWHAADLLNSAFVIGNNESRREAVEFILHNRALAPPLLVSFAEQFTQQVGKVDAVHGEEELSKWLHVVRARLTDEPRNAIQWVELSRLYILRGESARALKAMTVAAALGPNSRFVVRCAARLFLHAHDTRKALSVIRNAAGSKRDPWLLAAEIAVASASQLPSTLARIGKLRNEDEALSMFERTELSSALATLELENGKTRHARQLFRRSMASPNENSAAQVEWANRQIGGLDIRDRALIDIQRPFEVNAHLSLVEGKWAAAIEHGANWLRDQPFSKWPAIFTSYVSSLVEEYARSINILQESLRLNPNDLMLRNNLAFALASDNRTDDAIKVLRTTDYEKATGMLGITLAATHGLVSFRMGAPDLGRQLYRLAIERASRLDIQKYCLMADLYLAREEVLARTSATRTAVEQALAKASKSTDKEVAVVAEQVRRLFEKFLSEGLSSYARQNQ